MVTIEIEFDRETRDFAVRVNGQYVGSRKSRTAAEELAATERAAALKYTALHAA